MGTFYTWSWLCSGGDQLFPLTFHLEPCNSVGAENTLHGKGAAVQLLAWVWANQALVVVKFLV